MQLSEHFTLEEAMRSQAGSRLGYDNTPPEIIIPKLSLVATKILEPVHSFFGSFSPSSWYRSPNVNRCVGGVPTSQHVTGEAVDIVIPHIGTVEVAEWVRDHLEYDQLILEYFTPGRPFSGWTHVSFVGGEGQVNRKQVLTINRYGTTEGINPL